MTIPQIIQVITLIKSINNKYIVEIVVDGTHTHFICCFYHKINEGNINLHNLQQELKTNNIGCDINPMQLDMNLVLIVRNP